MKLKNAARVFDTCPVYDAYSGALLFKIQTSTFLESSTEGSTSARRTISVDPALVLPTHSAILALGQLILIGADNPDEWKGSAIRTAYWTKRITDDFKMLTPGEAALSAMGTRALGQKEYLRESLNAPTDSNLDPVWNIYISKSLTPDVGYFFRSVNTLFRVRSTYKDIDGFTTCLSDEVDEAPLAVSMAVGNAYDPITDTYTGTTVNTTGIQVDYVKAYTKKTQADFLAKTGDIALVVDRTATAGLKVGTEVTIASSIYAGKWRVLNFLQEADSFNLHLRRA